MSIKPALLELLDKPYKFISAYADEIVAGEVHRIREEYPEYEETVSTFLEDYNGDTVNYLASSSSQYDIDGLKVCEVFSKGGHEGGGEFVSIVWVVMDGEEILKYIRVNGYYQSYNGTTMNDEAEEVFPREVKVIKFFNEEELANHKED